MIHQNLRTRFQDAIVADPKMMIIKAGQVSTAISDMEKSFAELQSIVTRTSSYWTGAAGDYHRRMFEEEKDDITSILNRLKEHPDDLKLMATEYADTEEKLTAQNQQLKSDYI